jgi:hypothetical protein
MTWNVGDVRITRVVEFVMPFPVDFFAEATPEDVAAEAWLVPDFVDADGMYLMSLHTFVVESDGRRILVDTCTGNAKDRPLIPEFGHQHRPFLENLTAAGFAPDTIDMVVCTHLHVDHVGWNTRLVNGEWIPTFPGARYMFGAADFDCSALRSRARPRVRRLRGHCSSYIARVSDPSDHRVHGRSQAGHERLPLHRAAGMSRIDGHGMRVGNLFGYPTLVPRRDDPVTQRY